MSRPFYKLIIWNILANSLFVYGLLFGNISYFYTHDSSHITYVITALLMVSIFLALRNAQNYKQIVENYIIMMMELFPFIGLCGTIWGMSVLIRNIHVQAGASASNQIIGIIDVFRDNLSTLFNPTMFGLIAYVMMRISVFIIEGE